MTLVCLWWGQYTNTREPNQIRVRVEKKSSDIQERLELHLSSAKI